MVRHLVALLALLALASGCAHENPGAKAPETGSSGWITSPGYSWPPKTLQNGERSPDARAIELSKSDLITSRRRAPLLSDSLIPGGDDCLARLEAQNVRFQPLAEERGVTTPIQLLGPIGGVEFHSSLGPMIVDCRLALALTRMAPIFGSLGIRRARFSGAYVYRTARTGRLSLHAYGLAVDVHSVTSDREYSVKSDFERGLADGCAENAPLLNQLACRLKSQGLFQELLTPDYNADHYDHLHIGLAPLPEDGSALTAEPSSPAARHPRSAAKIPSRASDRI